jgi:hypothetical protein
VLVSAGASQRLLRLEGRSDEPARQDDQRLLGLLKHAWLESGGVYGYRKLTLAMRDPGETCGKHRVARLLKLEGLRSQIAVALACAVASLRSSRPTTCSASSPWRSPTSPG